MGSDLNHICAFIGYAERMHELPRLCLAASPLVLLLAACGEERASVVRPEGDPLMTSVLAGPIMADPDLVHRDAVNRAVSLAPLDGEIPLPDSGLDAIAAARADALDLVGGHAMMRSAPEAEEASGALPAHAALSVLARAASAGGEAMEGCAALAEFSAIWAARMPEAFPVYPRGAVHEAAGTNANGCALRAVNFTTPVPRLEAIDFYYTRALNAGYSAQRRLQDGYDIIAGTKDGAAFMVFARARSSGGTEIDLITGGS